MDQTKPGIYLERRSQRDDRGQVFGLFETDRNEYNTYLGKVECLTNNRDYAIIHDKVIPAISGPPGEEKILLDTGKYPSVGWKDFLESVTARYAKGIAMALSEKAGLELFLDSGLEE